MEGRLYDRQQCDRGCFIFIRGLTKVSSMTIISVMASQVTFIVRLMRLGYIVVVIVVKVDSSSSGV